MDVAYLQRLVEDERFVETLYYGALLLRTDQSAEVHLYLGVACCGSVLRIGQMEKADFEAPPGTPPDFPTGGLAVPRPTLLVYEGFFHFIEALRKQKGIMLPPSIRSVAREVLSTLYWYRRQEMHGYSSSLRAHSYAEVADGAIMLLHRLAGVKERETVLPRDFARELIDEELARTGGDAFFYLDRRPLPERKLEGEVFPPFPKSDDSSDDDLK